MHLEILSESPGITIKLGKNFSKILTGGDIIIFSGELGGGKIGLRQKWLWFCCARR